VRASPGDVGDPDPAFAHLSLESLRRYRRELFVEESRVSYWRRIVQARIDVVSAGEAPDWAHLRPLLTQDRIDSGRRALVALLPVDDIPPLPDLGELWDRSTHPHDSAARERLVADLEQAESELTGYRNALHRRLSEATAELIARYRQEPTLCLSVLPSPPS